MNNLAQILGQFGPKFGPQGNPNQGWNAPKPGMPTAPVNPPKSYLPQWQGMGQRRAEFGANFGADRGRNALMQMFQQHFRPQGQQPPQYGQQPNSLNPYGVAPEPFRNMY